MGCDLWWEQRWKEQDELLRRRLVPVEDWERFERGVLKELLEGQRRIEEKIDLLLARKDDGTD